MKNNRLIGCVWLVAILFLVVSPLKAQRNSLSAGIKEFRKGNIIDAYGYFLAGVELCSKPGLLMSELYYWSAKTNYLVSPSLIDSSLSLIEKSITAYPENINSIYYRVYLQNKTDPVQRNNQMRLNEILSLLEYDQVSQSILSKNFQNANSYYVLSVVLANLNNQEGAKTNIDKALSMGYDNYFELADDFGELFYEKDFQAILLSHSISESQIKELEANQSIQEQKTISAQNSTREKIQTFVTQYVEDKINAWQKKGKFEKTTDYLKRVSPESRQEKINYYTQKAIDSLGMANINWGELANEYDADNESFKLSFGLADPIYIYVPIDEAPSFDAQFHELEYSDIKFTLANGISPVIYYLEIANPDNGRSYIYSSVDDIAFKSTQLDFNFDEVELSIDDMVDKERSQKSKESTTVLNVGYSDVDTDIPITKGSSSNTYALIIGNEDYTKFQSDLNSEANVDFAKRDAEVFAEYAEKTLGVPKGNITLLTDAIGSQMNREVDKLAKLAKYTEGEATIIFYFAGHGFPDEVTKEAYIMPVDISGAYVQDGIKLSDLYAKLTSFPSKKVIVLLDACFSGGGRNQGLLAARSVAIKPKASPVTGNLLVFAASSDQQSSLPYANKQHGMFTYFLLKKLKETKGDVSMEELKDYVTKEVQITALKVNSKEQNPSIQISPNLDNVWMDWRIGE